MIVFPYHSPTWETIVAMFMNEQRYATAKKEVRNSGACLAYFLASRVKSCAKIALKSSGDGLSGSGREIEIGKPEALKI